MPKSNKQTVSDIATQEVTLRLMRARIEKVELESERKREEIIAELRQQVFFAIAASKRRIMIVPHRVVEKVRKAETTKEGIAILDEALYEALSDLGSLLSR